MEKIRTREDLRLEFQMATLDELSYTLGRYCGPHNCILAEKKYGHLAKYLQKIVNDEIASRQIEDFLLSD